jgi:hypothetical protein
MKPASKLLTAAALTVGVAGLLAASALAAPAARLPHAQHVSLAITGAGMDEHVAPSLGNVAIAAGVPVQVSVTNYTHEYHTFTIAGLHVSALIFPATGKTPKTTTFTFTASRTGMFRWHCAFCAGGAHGMPHDMGGTVYVVINPSALP